MNACINACIRTCTRTKHTILLQPPWVPHGIIYHLLNRNASNPDFNPMEMTLNDDEGSPSRGEGLTVKHTKAKTTIFKEVKRPLGCSTFKCCVWILACVSSIFWSDKACIMCVVGKVSKVDDRGRLELWFYYTNKKMLEALSGHDKTGIGFVPFF